MGHNDAQLENADSADRKNGITPDQRVHDDKTGALVRALSGEAGPHWTPWLRRIIVCGGRDYTDRDRMGEVLALYMSPADGGDEPTIVHGDARGADSLAADVGLDLGFWMEAHPADWKRDGKAAGPIRNQAMLDAGADLVLAFPGGRGTADMVRRARQAGVPVVEVVT